MKKPEASFDNTDHTFHRIIQAGKTLKIIPRPQLRQYQFSPTAQVIFAEDKFILGNVVTKFQECIGDSSESKKPEKYFPQKMQWEEHQKTNTFTTSSE